MNARNLVLFFLLLVLATLSCARRPSIVGTYDQVAATSEGKPEPLDGYRQTIVFQPDGHFNMEDSEGEHQMGTYRVTGKTIHIEMIDSVTNQNISYDSEFALENGVLVMKRGDATSTYNLRTGR